MGTLIINKKKYVVIEQKEFDKLQLLAAQKSFPTKKLSLAAGKKHAYKLIKPGVEDRLVNAHRPIAEEQDIIHSIKSVLKKDKRVATAWLFGSHARKEEKPGSDVDLMVELNKKKRYSMFDMLDIAFSIEKRINRKVDLVEKGYLKDFAMQTAAHDMVKIYG